MNIPVPLKVHQDLVELRVISASLRVMTGMFAGAGHRGMCAPVLAVLVLPYLYLLRTSTICCSNAQHNGTCPVAPSLTTSPRASTTVD